MKKLFATFVFALGLGASFAATAYPTCYYFCEKEKTACLNYAGTNAEARQQCYDEALACKADCDLG